MGTVVAVAAAGSGIGVSFRSAPAEHGVEAPIRGPGWARIPRRVSSTAETGGRESASQDNTLRTSAPRRAAASMNTPRTDGRGRDGVRRLWGGRARLAGRGETVLLYPLRVADLFEYVLGQQRRRRRRTLRRTRRAQLPRLAREREQVLLGAVGTPDTRKPVLKQPAVEVAQHLLVDEAAPEAVSALETLLPLPLHLVEVRLEEAIERRGAGIPGPVTGRTGLSHSDARRLLQRGRISPACSTSRQRSTAPAP